MVVVVMPPLTSVAAAARKAEPVSLAGPHLWRRMSLYARVVIVNTTVLLVAVVLLVVSPATVSFPVAAEQGVVLALGVTTMAVSNAVLMRVNFRGLTSVVRRMSTLDVLQLPERLPEMGGRDARTLIAVFNGMVNRLETERRTSTRRAVHALESERRRIGLELHDEIGQRLTGTLLELSRLAEEVPAHTRSLVMTIQDQQRSTLEEVGALAWQLRPALLDDLGLGKALESLAASMSERAGTEVEVSVPGAIDGLSSDDELAVYRVAQEAVTNALRHTRATLVQLTVRRTSTDLLLEVTDDGLGMGADAQTGPGIRGMRERALLVGGRLTVAAAPVRGVRVTLEVPTRLGQS
jgi:two-component system sensor histidine kinase UhpB